MGRPPEGPGESEDLPELNKTFEKRSISFKVKACEE
jgi:hypothetical protein